MGPNCPRRPEAPQPERDHAVAWDEPAHDASAIMTAVTTVPAVATWRWATREGSGANSVSLPRRTGAKSIPADRSPNHFEKLIPSSASRCVARRCVGWGNFTPRHSSDVRAGDDVNPIGHDACARRSGLKESKGARLCLASEKASGSRAQPDASRACDPFRRADIIGSLLDIL